MPHTKTTTGCKGWSRGRYVHGQDCRACYSTQNAATERQPRLMPGYGAAAVTAAPARQVASIRLPCIHLGDVQIPCPCGDTTRDVRHCLCEKADNTRCWRSPMPTNDDDIATCETCRHYSSGVKLTDVTLAITYWNRPASLQLLLESIDKHLPGCSVLVEDTGGNLSAGRNRLYARVDTEFLVVMEEDFCVVPDTVKGLRDALEILTHDPAIMAVGGATKEGDRGRVQWGHNFYLVDGECHIKPSERPMRRTPSGIEYRPCDLILNWGLSRTLLYQLVRWDQDFPITEHKEYYWRASQAGYEFAFYPTLRIEHVRSRPSATYNNHRHRNFHKLVRKKHGFLFHGGP